MRLLLVRHAIAEERLPVSSGGMPDRERRLTDEGKKKFRRGAEALVSLVPDLTVIATSPYVRARETAELLARACGGRPVVSELADLSPEGDSAGVLKFAAAQKALPAVALVGHEPNLSMLAGYLLTGRERGFVVLRKGGACLLDFPGRLAAGGAVLLWHLAPGMLRALR